jgi:hypothetical protein
MSKISISEVATDKILRDRRTFIGLRGRDLTPCLTYYSRCYSNLNDGRVIEHGSGLLLSFIEPAAAEDKQYLRIPLDSNCTVALHHYELFQMGGQSIDWVDRKFTLSSIE